MLENTDIPAKKKPRGKPFTHDDPRINKKGRPRKGFSIAEICRDFFQQETTIKRTDSKGRETQERINRTILFLEALYGRAIKDSDAAAKLLWNYIDGQPPFSGRIGGLPDDGDGVDPEDEEAIVRHLRGLIQGKGQNGNGDTPKK